MKTLVLSDVHLSPFPDGRDTMARFTAFLRWIDPAIVGRLVVLGDLFDFWFEYRHVAFSGYFPVLQALANLRDRGVELHFIRGNHDFWAGRFLREGLGFQVHDEALLSFGERRVLFVHGDGVNPKDWSYRLYKRIARARFVVAAFRLIHPDWAMAIARAVSHGSRSFHAKDVSKGSEIAPLRLFAQRRLSEGRLDAVVCGHCHYPELTEFPPGEGEGLYINTGDWLYHQTFALWGAEEGFRLYSWDEEPQEIAREKRECSEQKAHR